MFKDLLLIILGAGFSSAYFYWQTNILFKIGNKLEQRIATLEKVLQSHAKCIGELREDKNE